MKLGGGESADGQVVGLLVKSCLSNSWWSLQVIIEKLPTH